MMKKYWRVENLRSSAEIAIDAPTEEMAKKIAKEKYGFQFPKCSGRWTVGDLEKRRIGIV